MIYRIPCQHKNGDIDATATAVVVVEKPKSGRHLPLKSFGVVYVAVKQQKTKPWKLRDVVSKDHFTDTLYVRIAGGVPKVNLGLRKRRRITNALVVKKAYPRFAVHHLNHHQKPLTLPRILFRCSVFDLAPIGTKVNVNILFP